MALETLESIGALLGSGGVVIFDDSVCMVDINNYLVNFNELESCGRCVTCRIGTIRRAMKASPATIRSRATSACKRRRENPSLKRPGSPVAPE